MDYNKMITVPIHKLTESQHKIFDGKYEVITAIKKQNPQADTIVLENTVELLIFKLHNLTFNEVEVINPKIEEIVSEAEYEKIKI